MIFRTNQFRLIFHGLLSLITSLVFVSNLAGQNKEYKQYINKENQFSFDIPRTWKIFFSERQEGMICIPSNQKEKKIYEDCFEGIIFRMDIYHSGLDSTLLKENYYKAGAFYYTTDRFSDSVKTQFINGKNWKGIYHNNVCGISCKETGFHAAAGECEFLYFSNGSLTVCINTNGRAFDKKIMESIISSFRFIKA